MSRIAKKIKIYFNRLEMDGAVFKQFFQETVRWYKERYKYSVLFFNIIIKNIYLYLMFKSGRRLH